LQPRFLSVRNLERPYRVDTVIETFALLKRRYPHATLTIAGHGSDEPRLRTLATAVRVDGIRFLGRVEPDKVPASATPPPTSTTSSASPTG